jgi:GDP-4-dehydro-6-deoxy-D-mannose reductase
MIALVSGASGFIGSHLVEHLLARGDTVIAFQRKQGRACGGLQTIEGDVLDANSVARAIKQTGPQVIYHLAAQSLPKVSWDQPGLTHHVNVGGTLNVLGAAAAAPSAPTVVIASSSSIYAERPDGGPIREDDPCLPASPYGVSKLAVDHLSRLYAHRYGIPVIIARPFFLIGPRKAGDVCSDWARNIVAIERGQTDALAVGNLETERDFLHIADAVSALAVIAGKGIAGQAYNVCSGRGWKLKDVLGNLTKLAHREITVRADSTRMRALDERIKVGDPSKLRKLGWREQHGVEVALEQILQYWREQDPER